jgi:hypothetical protein
MSSFEDFVDSSVVTIPETEFGIKKQEKVRYSTMLQSPDFDLLVIRHKTIPRRKTSIHVIGFQGAYIEVGNGHGDLDFKVFYDQDKDGNPCQSRKRATLYPVGEFKFLKGAIPLTDMNMDRLAELFYTGPYQLDKMTPNYQTLYNKLKEIADTKYKKKEVVEPTKALAYSEEANNALRDEVKKLEVEKEEMYQLTKNLLGKTNSDKLYQEAKNLVQEENSELIKEMKNDAKIKGNTTWHTTSEYKKKITPLIKAKFVHLAKGFKD